MSPGGGTSLSYSITIRVEIENRTGTAKIATPSARRRHGRRGHRALKSAFVRDITQRP
jgi:hypothetical protein